MSAAPIKALPNSSVHEQRWSPYVDNGGTVLGVCGEDFAIVAGDTRMSFGYSIASRDVSKVHQLTNKCVIGTSGQQAEAATLHKVLESRLAWYKHQHGKDMSVTAIAQLLSTTLYYKRFFPYYTFNIVGGVDENGKGHVFGYDAVGSFERVPYVVTGSGSALVTSLFDNQIAFLNQPKNKRTLSYEETLALVQDAMTSCGERDIYTGDSVDICTIRKSGIEVIKFPLKKD